MHAGMCTCNMCACVCISVSFTFLNFVIFYVVGLGTYFCYKSVIQWPVCIYVIIRLKMIKSYREIHRSWSQDLQWGQSPTSGEVKNKTTNHSPARSQPPRPEPITWQEFLLEVVQVRARGRPWSPLQTWKLSWYTARHPLYIQPHSCTHSPPHSLTSGHSHGEGLSWGSLLVVSTFEHDQI